MIWCCREVWEQPEVKLKYELRFDIYFVLFGWWSILLLPQESCWLGLGSQFLFNSECCSIFFQVSQDPVKFKFYFDLFYLFWFGFFRRDRIFIDFSFGDLSRPAVTNIIEALRRPIISELSNRQFWLGIISSTMDSYERSKWCTSHTTAPIKVPRLPPQPPPDESTPAVVANERWNRMWWI